jgi:uncharacterized protein YcnI
MFRRSLSRAGAVAAASTAVILGLALPASAHVTVNPKTLPGGGFGALTFRVPTEKDNASTTKVEVAMPAGQPIASIGVKPVPGWTVQVTKSKLAKPLVSDDGPVTEAVSRITWTATSPATAIAPGQFQEFEISGGPLPKTGTLTFKALQTYSDGSVVRWIETSTPGGAEPEHPAPVLTLTAPAATTAAAPAATAPAATATKQAAPVADSTDNTSRGIAIAALVAGLLGLLLGGIGFLAGRRRGAATAGEPGADREMVGSGRAE